MRRGSCRTRKSFFFFFFYTSFTVFQPGGEHRIGQPRADTKREGSQEPCTCLRPSHGSRSPCSEKGSVLIFTAPCTPRTEGGHGTQRGFPPVPRRTRVRPQQPGGGLAARPAAGRGSAPPGGSSRPATGPAGLTLPPRPGRGRVRGTDPPEPCRGFGQTSAAPQNYELSPPARKCPRSARRRPASRGRPPGPLPSASTKITEL